MSKLKIVIADNESIIRMDLKEILNSMQRHLAKLMDGEEVDSESGISHMGHIQCNGMFYNYHKNKENGNKN